MVFPLGKHYSSPIEKAHDIHCWCILILYTLVCVCVCHGQEEAEIPERSQEHSQARTSF